MIADEEKDDECELEERFVLGSLID